MNKIVKKKLTQQEIKSLTSLIASKVNQARNEKWVGKRVENEFPKLYKLQQDYKKMEDKVDRWKSEIQDTHSISLGYWRGDGKITAHSIKEGLIMDEIIIANLSNELDVDKIINEMVAKFG